MLKKMNSAGHSSKLVMVIRFFSMKLTFNSFTFQKLKRFHIHTKRRFRSINWGLNDKGICCGVHAQTLPKIPSLATVD